MISAKNHIKDSFYSLDALRGFAAITVAFYHVVFFKDLLDPGYYPSVFAYFYDESVINVLLFFVVSGTVIGLNYQRLSNRKQVLKYIKKRLIRIYPIYFISLVLALLISKSAYPILTIAGNFTFMQVLFSDMIKENSPSWSLHYEVLFYILFIIIARLNINPVKTAICVFLTGAVNLLAIRNTHFILLTAYCFGFTFWMSGLIIAKYFSKPTNSTVNYRRCISFIFLLMCIPYLNKIKMLMVKYSDTLFHHTLSFKYANNGNDWYKIAINLYDFSYLPFCFIAIIIFSNYSFRFIKLLLVIAQALPLAALYSLHKIGSLQTPVGWLVPVICYTASCILCINLPILNRGAAYLFKLFAWLGNISYAIYIIHMPILFLFARLPFFTGSVYSFTARLLLYCSLTILTAHLLENLLQPQIVKYCMRRNWIAKKEISIYQE